MQNKNNKTDQFKNISPGMFIHWRVYSVPWFGELRVFVKKISPQEDVNTYTCCFYLGPFCSERLGTPVRGRHHEIYGVDGTEYYNGS